MTDNFEVKILDISAIGKPVLCNVFLEGEKEALGNALLFVSESECLLWDIDVLVKHRRTGVASAILTAIKTQYDYITTSWKGTPGRKLCLKNGFKIEQTGKGNNALVWRRELDAESAEKSG